MGEKITDAAALTEKAHYIDKHYLWFLFGIVFLTALIYSNSVSNGITSLDDREYITYNPYLKDLSFEGIKNIFTSFYASNYHPITTLTWAVEYYFFGDSAQSYHVINLMIHLLNVILVFYFVKNLIRKNTTALIVTLLFAVHPMHVESVSWIAERKDVLYSFFFLAALIFYLKYIRNNFSLKFIAAAFLMFILSLFSKPAAVTLPVILFIIDYYLKRGFDKRLIIEKLPFLALSLVFGIITLISQKDAIESYVTPYFSITDRMLFTSYAIVYYLVMAVFPFNFSVFHFYPERSGSMLPVEFYLSLLVIIALVILFFKAGKQRRLLVLCFGLFLVGLSLVIQIIPVGQAIVAERYTYIPYIGLFILVTELVLNTQSKLKTILLASVACLTLYFCVSTYQRNIVWRNSITLFEDVYEKYPDSYYSGYALGNAYYDEGNAEDAIEFYTRSIKINPDFGNSYNNRGVMKNEIKDYSGAVEDLTIALKYPTASYETFFSRGIAYFNNAEIENAIRDFDAVLLLKDDYTDAYIFRANAKSALEKYEEALIDYDKAIELDPDNGLAYSNRATTKYNLNDTEGACADWQTAVNLGYAEDSEMQKNICGEK
jgi:protein O-mannosyl-transferase